METNTITLLRHITKTDLQAIVNSKSSISEVLEYFGYIPQRKDSRKLLNKLILELNIDLSIMHINQHNKFKKTIHERSNKKNNALNYFKNEKFISGTFLFKKIKEFRLIPITCNGCGIGEIYNNKPIKLQIHHIDGNNKNNEINNLMLLCPNCHSQTTTFCGRKNKKEPNICKCGTVIKRYSKMCRKCTQEYQIANGRYSEKFSVSKNELEELIKIKSMVEIGKLFSVTSKSIKKRCIKLGIDLNLAKFKKK